MKGKWSVLALALVLGLVLGGCAQEKKEEKKEAAPAAGKIILGVAGAHSGDLAS